MAELIGHYYFNKLLFPNMFAEDEY